MACGTGNEARCAASGPYRKVRGLDRNPAMLPFALHTDRVDEYVQDYVCGSPLSGHVAEVLGESRAALISDVGALTSYVA